MKTLEQFKEDLQNVQAEVSALEELANSMVVKNRALREANNILSILDNTRNYNPKVYEDHLSKMIPVDAFREEVIALEKEVNQYDSSKTYSLRNTEHELKNKVSLIERLGLKSDDFIELGRKLPGDVGVDRWKMYYNLSNYKKSTLFNQNVLTESLITVRIEEGSSRKADVLLESGFYECKFYVNVLKMSSKMRTTYILTEDSEDIQVEIAIYDNKTETFQKLGTLPSIKREDLIDSIKKGV